MQTPLEISSVVFKPILIRAVVALAFGLTTVFVAEPGLTWMKVMFALYLAFSGSAMWEYLRRDPVPVAMRSPLSLAAAAWMLGVIVLLFLGSPAAVGVAEKTSGPLTVVRRPPRAGRPDPARSADGRGDGALTAGLLTAGGGWGDTARTGARG